VLVYLLLSWYSLLVKFPPTCSERNLVIPVKLVRWVNIITAIVFLLFNVGFLIEAHVGWEYLLEAGYLLFNGLIVWYAWKWPGQGA
jgi:hypothetical protein